jgi:FkbM family methyltransferase
MIFQPPGAAWAAKAALYREFCEGTRRPRLVLGTNQYADAVGRELAVDAFIDDYTSARSFHGRPVLRLSDVPKEAIVISAVVEARPLTACQRLRERGIERVLDYFALLRFEPGRFRLPPHSEFNAVDLSGNRGNYDWLRAQLADEESQVTFDRVIRFRTTWELECMAGFRMRPQDQYFESFTAVAPGAVFVDGGGFDGETTVNFAARCPDYRAIHFFEPAPSAMAVAQRRLATLGRIHFHPEGLAETAGEASFDPDACSASRVTDAGASRIRLAALDEAVPEAVDFIKLDIEGFEYAALAGARRHIQHDQPKLAVCVYHDQRDFWRIPQRVLEYAPGQRIYLRHYTEGILETVMYLIPAGA